VKKFKLLLLALAFATSFAALPEEPNSARTLTFKHVLATRVGDRNHVYVLLGGGWLRGLQFGDTDGFITAWLKVHPHATFQAISREGVTNARSNATGEWVYIWVEDDAASLNVDLVRAGYFPGAAMADMVDNDKGLLATLNDPKLADAKAQVLKERADNPQDLPRRLVPDEDYSRRMDRIIGAENAARIEKLGIWSEAMQEERAAAG
jgi:hypothetical protein